MVLEYLLSKVFVFQFYLKQSTFQHAQSRQAYLFQDQLSLQWLKLTFTLPNLDLSRRRFKISEDKTWYCI